MWKDPSCSHFQTLGWLQNTHPMMYCDRALWGEDDEHPMEGLDELLKEALDTLLKVDAVDPGHVEDELEWVAPSDVVDHGTLQTAQFPAGFVGGTEQIVHCQSPQDCPGETGDALPTAAPRHAAVESLDGSVIEAS